MMSFVKNLFQCKQRAIKIDFPDMPYLEQLAAYSKMKEPIILKVLRYRMTENVIANACSKDNEKYKAKIEELAELIEAIENVEENMLKVNEDIKKKNMILSSLSRSAWGKIKYKLFRQK